MEISSAAQIRMMRALSGMLETFVAYQNKVGDLTDSDIASLMREMYSGSDPIERQALYNIIDALDKAIDVMENENTIVAP